jgi:predicted ATP-grasp superfamily ATP-dependent carboligase
MASSSAVSDVRASERLPVLILRLVPNPLHHGAVAIARSLGQIGAEVWAAVEADATPVARSRYVAGTLGLQLPTRDESEVLAVLLEWSRRRGDHPLLIPIDDAAAVFLADNATALADGFRFPSPPAGLARRLSSKLELSRLCAEAGVPTPRVLVPTDDEELAGAAEQLRFPVMVKRISEWDPATQSGPRMARAESLGELRLCFAEMRSAPTPNLLIQEYVGDGIDWMFNGYFDDESRCLYGATGFKVRQYPIATGATSLGECRHNEDVYAHAVELLTAVGYRGIIDAGMRFDPRDRTYKLLDVNPRIGSTFRLFTGRAGLDVARALYLDFAGRSFDGDRPADGRRWLVENYDLASSLIQMRSRELSPLAWAGSLHGVREVAWASVSDPRPAVSAFLHSTRLLARRRRRRPA